MDSIIRSQMNEHGQVLNIRVHEIAHEYLIGDGVRLRQIFLNLLSNAVKYTPEDGSITFDVAVLACEVPDCAKFCFSVTDTGYGMEPDFVTHIFEPFTRAESSVTNKVQGTGLGMAITKNIVDLMGGTITVESEVNMGSRFAVTLMLKIDPDARYDLGAKDILLISDDDTLIRNMSAPIRGTDLNFTVVSSKEETMAFLAKHHVDVVLLAGYLRDQSLSDMVRTLRKLSPDALLIFCVDFAQREQVQETLTQCGAELIKAFERVKPGEHDAILMDIQMPRMNGYEATKAIRGGENPLGRTIPIIAMTANAFSDDVQNSLAADMDAHVSKPIDIAVLEKTMRSITPPNSLRGGFLSARYSHSLTFLPRSTEH